MADQEFLEPKTVFRAPWEDEVSRRVPISIKHALYWCEHVAFSNQLLAAALRKLVSYFITDLEFTGVEPDEVEELRNYFYDTLHINSVLHAIGLDYLIYGNSFITITNLISRSVICPKCGFATPFLPYANNPQTKFRFENKKDFVFTCLKCKYDGPWSVDDKIEKRTDSLSIIRWSPHDIEIIWDPISQKAQYALRIPPEYRGLIERGATLPLAYVPEQILEAIRTNQDFIFYDDSIIHLREPAPAGIRMQGWGISPLLANFRQAWLVELLRSANQTIAYDYTLPIRILSPEPRASPPEIGDPLMTLRLGDISSSLESIIANWRKNPASWYSTPFPVRYQVIGGEGNRVLPPQLIDQANIDLIAGLGIPVEFFKGTLTIQAMPVALRLLEGTWNSLRYVLNIFLQKLANTLQNLFRFDEFSVALAKPSYIDDINRQMAKIQLGTSGVISMETALGALGLNYVDELKRKIQEQEIQIKQYQELQNKMQQESMTQMLSAPQEGGMDILGLLGGGGGAGAAPQTQQGQAPTQSAPQGNPQDPISMLLAQIPASASGPVPLDTLSSVASQLAQQLYGYDSTMRISALRRIKQRNPVIHALVIQELQNLDTSAEMQGRMQARQQAQQQAQGQVQMPI